MEKPPTGRLMLGFFLLLCFSYSRRLVTGQPPTDPSQQPPEMTSSFRPSIAIVIGILSIMFSFTFLLLMYAKFCHAGADDVFADNAGGLGGPGARFSGIDKAVIESLPLFRFSSLRGSKEGLECAVCLSRFEDTEVLRLLPKCKHAFHLECVDRWLESHSSCPLCRHKIDPGDLTTFAYSNSLRYPGRDPPAEHPLDLFVEREPDAGDGPDIAAGSPSSSSSSARFSFLGSFRKQGKSKKEEGLIGQSERRRDLHRFKHRIVVSDVMLQARWSDVNSSDLMLLSSEMLNADSGRRLSAPAGYSASERYTAKPVAAGGSVDVDIHSLKQEMDQKRATESKAGGIINPSFSAIGLPSSSTSQQPMNHVTSASSEKRSMSELTNLSRFGRLMRTKEAREASINGSGGSEASSVKEERLRRIWLPIARRTVRWLAGRERREESQSHGGPNTRQELNA